MALVPDNRWTDPHTGEPTNIPFAGAPPQFRDDGLGDLSPISSPTPFIPPQEELRRFERGSETGDYDGIYGGDEPSTGLSLMPPTGGPELGLAPLAAIPIVIAISALIARFGMSAVGPIISMLRFIGIPIGSRLSWSLIPQGIRLVLVSLGIAEGTDLLFDTDGSGQDTGLIPLPTFGGGGSPSGIPPRPTGTDAMSRLVNALYVGGWFAQTVAFYRLSDGRLAVRNKKGVWKIWRPKKPIVIMPTGMSNIKDILRADKVLDKQSKAMADMLRRRGSQVRKKVNPSDSDHE